MSKLADELKKAFLQGNVPNETNYQKLIELADPQLGNGLKVKPDASTLFSRPDPRYPDRSQPM